MYRIIKKYRYLRRFGLFKQVKACRTDMSALSVCFRDHALLNYDIRAIQQPSDSLLDFSYAFREIAIYAICAISRVATNSSRALLTFSISFSSGCWLQSLNTLESGILSQAFGKQSRTGANNTFLPRRFAIVFIWIFLNMILWKVTIKTFRFFVGIHIVNRCTLRAHLRLSASCGYNESILQNGSYTVSMFASEIYWLAWCAYNRTGLD